MAPRPGPFHDRLSTAAAGAAPPVLRGSASLCGSEAGARSGWSLRARCPWELVAGDGRMGEVVKKLVWELAQGWQRSDGVGTLQEAALSSPPLPAEGL